MRFDLLLFTILVPIFAFTPRLLAAENEAVSVQWYEPKVQPSTVANLNYVSLVGLTEPSTSVQVDAKNIIVIQPADPNTKIQPRVGETLVKSDAKGFFRLRLFMPNGLSQVPILLKNPQGATHTVLLTMRVDPKDVSLNVKVIRPTKTKIVTVVEKPPVLYSIGAGWAPSMFHEALSPSGQPSLDTQFTSIPAVRVEADLKSSKWWILGNYQLASNAAPSTLDGRNVKSGNYNLQSALLEARYRLNETENELWADLGASAFFFPLLTLNNTNEILLTEARLFSLRLGLSYFIKAEKFDYTGSIYYREPVAIKVASGEVAYTSQYSFVLNGEVNYKWTNRWSWGASGEFESTSFNYEYTNSPSQIANKGSGSLTNLQVLGKIRYVFDERK
jgi:hypothetical protein